jgi:hypothetical protein
MQRGSVVAGVGGILFAVLWFLTVFVADPPGGGYSASDVASFVDKDHRTAIFVAVALGLLSVLGLLLLLAGLRERVSGGDSLTATVFWSASLLSVAGLAIGWVTVLTVPISRAFGGSTIVVIDPALTYTITEIGWVIMFAVGGTFLGVALITSVIGSAQAYPAWLRWFTLVVGVLGLASLAWIPFFALLIWAIITSLWLIAAGRAGAPVAPPRPAS